MSNSPNIDNEKIKTTEDPKTQSSPRPTASGYVEFERSDIPKERVERLGQYLSHSTKNSSNVDERNATAYGNIETSTLDVFHQSGKTRADYDIGSPDVASNLNATFLNDVPGKARDYFSNISKDVQTFPREIIQDLIPEDDKVSSPNLTYGNGHRLLTGNAEKITEQLIDNGKNEMLVNSRWAGVGQKRFPQQSSKYVDPNIYARTNRFEPQHTSEYNDYEHPSGQKMSETLGNDMKDWWPEYHRRVGKFGPAMQNAAKPHSGVANLSVENVFDHFESVDARITNEQLPSITSSTWGQQNTSENPFDPTKYVHQVPEKKKAPKIWVPIPDITGPLNHPSIRTAETRMNGRLRSRLSLQNVPSLMLNPPNAAKTREMMEKTGLGDTKYGTRSVDNSMLWMNIPFGPISPGDVDRKKIKELVGQRYQERTDGRFSPEQVKYMEDMLEAEHMPFYIQDLRTNEVIGFHAFLTSISDSYTGEWSAQKGFGRLEAAQIYGGGSRSIGVSFTMVAMNPGDFDEMYVKINKLTTLVYPQWSRGTLMQQGDNKFVQPFSQVPTASPLCRIRVGDLFTSNYSKKAMARMMGIEEAEFVYEIPEYVPDPPEPTDENPSKVRSAIEKGIEKAKEKTVKTIDTAKWWLKESYWGVIANQLAKLGVPESAYGINIYGIIKKEFDSKHKQFVPKIISQPIPYSQAVGKNIAQLPSDSIVEKTEILTEKAKEAYKDQLATIVDSGKGMVDKYLGDFAAKGEEWIEQYGDGSYQKWRDGKLKNTLNQFTGKYESVENLLDVPSSSLIEGAEGIDSQMEYIRQANPVADVQNIPTEVHQIMIQIPKIPLPGNLPKLIPSEIPFYQPSYEKEELENYILEGPYFETNPDAPRVEIDPQEEEKTPVMKLEKKTKPRQLIDLFDSNKNPIFKSFESSMGRGIAVAITSIGLEWKLNSAPWSMEVGDRAPRMCEISLGLIPIHDITPGLDHNGFNRAPIYKVGSSRNETGDVWYNEEEFKELQKNIKRDTLVALVPWGKIIKGAIE